GLVADLLVQMAKDENHTAVAVGQLHQGEQGAAHALVAGGVDALVQEGRDRVDHHQAGPRSFQDPFPDVGLLFIWGGRLQISRGGRSPLPPWRTGGLSRSGCGKSRPEKELMRGEWSATPF